VFHKNETFQGDASCSERSDGKLQKGTFRDLTYNRGGRNSLVYTSREEEMKVIIFHSRIVRDSSMQGILDWLELERKKLVRRIHTESK